MLNIAKDMSSSQGIAKNKQYEAVVVANDDSKSEDKRRLCRIKARIAGIFDGIEDEDLPWAIPDYHHADGASSTSGSQCIPKIGSKVLLEFQDGSSEHPMYSGYIVDSTTMLQEMEHNYPDRKVIRYQYDALVVVDTKTKEIFIRNPGDFNIFIEGNANISVTGNVVEKVMGDRTSYIKGNVVEIVDGNKVTHVKGNSAEIVDGNSNTAVKGNKDQSVAGSSTVFTTGADSHGSAATMLRHAPYINDDLPQGGSPAAPANPTIPTLEAWPGIRGSIPA